jgi:hypothetical protein
MLFDVCRELGRTFDHAVDHCLAIELGQLGGHHMGRTTSFHSQRGDCAGLRLHDRPFNSVETGENRLDPTSHGFITGLFIGACFPS